MTRRKDSSDRHNYGKTGSPIGNDTHGMGSFRRKHREQDADAAFGALLNGRSYKNGEVEGDSQPMRVAPGLSGPVIRSSADI